MSIVTRGWFFVTTATALVKGTRFKSNDRPTEATFRDLTDSALFKSESGDRAKEDSGSALSSLNGHVVAATDAQAKANQAKKSDRTLVAQPSQLPSVSAANVETTSTGFTGQTITVTVDPSESTRNKFLVKISTAFTEHLNAIIDNAGVVFAAAADIFAASNVSKSVKPNQLPTSIQDDDNTILGFTGKTIDISVSNTSEHKAYGFKFTSAFANWLAAALTPTSTGLIYISSAGNDITGNGSITNPYLTIAKGITVSLAGSGLPIVVLGGTYLITEPLPAFNKNISFANGAIVTYTDATSGRYLFTATNAGFSISGSCELTISNIGSYLLTVLSTTGTVVVSAKKISGKDSLFKFKGVPGSGANGAIQLRDTQVVLLSFDSGNVARNIFVDSTNISNTGDYTLLCDLDGGSFKFDNCDFSHYFIGVQRINRGATSLISNSTFYGTQDFGDMPYLVTGLFLNGGVYCLTIDNTIFDCAQRLVAPTSIKLTNYISTVVMRGCVFDRGTAAAAGALSIDSTTGTTIYASDCLDSCGNTAQYILGSSLPIPSQTIAANTIVTSVIHNLKVGDRLYTVSSTVTGITTYTTYYVLTVPTTTSFTVSTSSGGSTQAISGTGVIAYFEVQPLTYLGTGAYVTNSIRGGIKNIKAEVTTSVLFNTSVQV